MSQSRSESCSNIIRIPDNQRLRLTVHSLDSNCLGSYSQYSYDWLEIHDGINQGKPLIRKRLCDEFAMKPFTSISNELLVRFESETYGERIGYNITIEKGIMLQLSLSIAKFDKFKKILTYLNMSTEFAHLYLASKCFCEHKIGFSKNNGIMCEKNGGLERHTYCTDDEWCIGATDKIEATYHVESLCVKGNY